MNYKLLLLLAVFLIHFSKLNAQDTLILQKGKLELNKYLERYRYCNLGLEDCKEPRNLLINELYYSNYAKQRLLELLRNDWAEEEKHSIAKALIKKDIQKSIQQLNLFLADSAKYFLSKKRKTFFIRHLDSLQSLVRMDLDSFPEFIQSINNQKIALTDLKVDDKIIFYVGMILDKGYLPALQEALESSEMYNVNIIKLAMARLGVDIFYQEILKKNSIELPYKPSYLGKNRIATSILSDYQQRSSMLLYLCTQESIYELSNWLSLTGAEYQFEVISHSGVISSIADYAAESLSFMLLNEDFQQYFSNRSVSPPVQNSDIEFIKNWMESNKGKYELNKTLFPF
jgi:hypothetical protein